MNSQLIANLHQQTKRLVDQLRELEENRQELDQEEYEEIRQSTLADLETFQQYLVSLQKGDAILDSEVDKSRKSIMEAVRKSVDTKAIMGKLMQQQVEGLRSQLSGLDNADQLKKISKEEYYSKKRKLLVALQETGCELSKEQKEWLQLNHFDESSGAFSKEAESKHMSVAEETIKKFG